MSKTHLLSLTRADFDWQFFRAGGKGGQKQNKTSSACRCVHQASGAVGESREERSQIQNRRLAFTRCVNSKQFQTWLKIESAAIAAGFANAERQVDAMLQPENLKIEYYTPTGDTHV
jgi:protein subunit release factor B